MITGTRSAVSSIILLILIFVTPSGVYALTQAFTFTGSGGGGGSGPAPALAGCSAANGGGPNNGSCFNTQIFHMDFSGATQSFIGTNGSFDASQDPSSVWMKDCGGSAPQPIGRAVFAQPNPAPCNRYTIVNDGGTKVLDMLYTATDHGNGIGAVLLKVWGPNFFVTPLSWYWQATVRSDSTSLSNAQQRDVYAIFSAHLLSWNENTSSGPQAPFIEEDSDENIGGVAGLSNVVPWTGCAPSGACNQGNEIVDLSQGNPYDWTQYHTIGMRVTNDGGANFTYCAYVDGANQGCKTIGTAQGSTTDAAFDRNGGFGFQGGGEGGGGPLATGDVHVKYKSSDIYSCPSWNNGWSYNSGTGVGISNGNPCAGGLITAPQ